MRECSLKMDGLTHVKFVATTIVLDSKGPSLEKITWSTEPLRSLQQISVYKIKSPSEFKRLSNLLKPGPGLYRFPDNNSKFSLSAMKSFMTWPLSVVCNRKTQTAWFVQTGRECRRFLYSPKIFKKWESTAETSFLCLLLPVQSSKDNVFLGSLERHDRTGGN